MRQFTTGALRNADEDKLDYEGFLSPSALKAFAEYMHKHRKLPDGTVRASDNWQLGIPTEQLMKSLLRHVMAVWLAHRQGVELSLDDLCGVMFNVQGLIHEQTKPIILDSVPTDCKLSDIVWTGKYP